MLRVYAIIAVLPTLASPSNIFASSISDIISQISDLVSNNIYCPQTLFVTQHHHFIADTSVFTSGAIKPNMPFNKKLILFYFTNATFAPSTSVAQCHYATKNGQFEYTLYTGKAIKPNIDAISNNWTVEYNPLLSYFGLKLLTCRYNEKHCPFEAY